MKWPFVSRIVFDDVCRQRDAERARYDRLLDLVLKLKPGGAIVHTASPNQPSPPPSGIERAIAQNKHARMNPAIRTQLQRYADEQLALGVSPADVELVLRNWDKVAADREGLTAQPDDRDTIAVVM